MKAIEFTSDYKQNQDVFEELNEHRPFRRLVTYFDAENYLLTPYREITEAYAVLVLESYDGEVIAIRRCNCGYSGEGPGKTQKVLEFLGIPKELSEQYKLYSGIDIEFNEDGTFKKDSVKLDCVFDSRAATPQNGKILIGKNSIFSNMSTRQIFFLNPQFSNFYYLLNAIARIRPMQMSYYIGTNNRKYVDLYFNRYNNQELESLMFGPYVIISSNEFDIVCLINQDTAMSFINCIHMIITGKPLFYEANIGGLAFFSNDIIEYLPIRKKVKMFSDIFFGKQEQVEYHDIVRLTERG